MNRISGSIRVRRNRSPIVAFSHDPFPRFARDDKPTHISYLCRPVTEDVTLRFAQGDKTIIKKNRRCLKKGV
jgi:hypothetical protein